MTSPNGKWELTPPTEESFGTQQPGNGVAGLATRGADVDKQQHCYLQNSLQHREGGSRFPLFF